MTKNSLLVQIENDILLMEWRYFVITILSVIILFPLLSLIYSGVIKPIMFIFLILGIAAFQAGFIIYARHKEDYRKNGYASKLNPVTKEREYIGYTPQPPFIRDGAGNKFSTLKLSILSQAIIVYATFSYSIAYIFAIIFFRILD